MLQHMLIVDRLKSILARVDKRTVIAKLALEDERARVSLVVGRGVVAAGVVAKSAHVANVAVLVGVLAMRFG